MGGTRWKKQLFSFSLLPTSQSAFCVPPPHAILSLFPPLSCLTCWLTPPPSLLFSLSGWYVPWTKSTDGERAKRSRGQEVTKKRGGEGGALAGEQFPFLPHAHSSLCCPLAQWDFIESAQLRKCAVLASRKWIENQSTCRHYTSKHI